MIRRLLRPQHEERARTFQALWASGEFLSPTTRAGVPMSQQQAMTISAVYSAVRLISDSIATLPMDTFIRRNGERYPYRPRPAWIDQPDPDPSVARSDWMTQLLVSMLVWHGFVGRILRDGNGEVLAIAPIDPTRVEPRRNARGFVEFVVDGTTVLSSDDVVYIPDMRKPGAVKGTSRVDEVRETLGITKALDDFAARYFGSGTLSSGIISYPGDMTEEQAGRLKDQFEKNSRGLRNAHRPNVLTGGAKYERISDSPEDSQLVASREFSVLEVCRIFKIQPSMLGVVTAGARSYASVEQDYIGFVTTTLRPYVHKIEEALTRLLPPGVFLRINMEGLQRGDLQSRYAAYSQGIQAGFLSINDIHRLEDMRPVDGGDVYRVQLANVNLDAANITETQMRVSMATQLINAGFDPEATLAAMDLPPIDHTGLPSVQLQNVMQVEEAEDMGSTDSDGDMQEGQA
jgi:HK97 family phage portal protein